MTEGLFPEPKRRTPWGRRFLRRRKQIFIMEVGLHPLALTHRSTLKIKPGTDTCGTCAHCQPLDRDVPLGKTVYKCWAWPQYVTRGDATTIRKKWPACVLWRSRDGKQPDGQDHPSGA